MLKLGLEGDRGPLWNGRPREIFDCSTAELWALQVWERSLYSFPIAIVMSRAVPRTSSHYCLHSMTLLSTGPAVCSVTPRVPPDIAGLPSKGAEGAWRPRTAADDAGARLRSWSVSCHRATSLGATPPYGHTLCMQRVVCKDSMVDPHSIRSPG